MKGNKKEILTAEHNRNVADKVNEENVDLKKRLENGRHYLMSVKPSELTVEDALEAFGFERNGL